MQYTVCEYFSSPEKMPPLWPSLWLKSQYFEDGILHFCPLQEPKFFIRLKLAACFALTVKTEPPRFTATPNITWRNVTKSTQEVPIEEPPSGDEENGTT